MYRVIIKAQVSLFNLQELESLMSCQHHEVQRKGSNAIYLALFLQIEIQEGYQ